MLSTRTRIASPYVCQTQNQAEI